MTAQDTEPTAATVPTPAGWRRAVRAAGVVTGRELRVRLADRGFLLTTGVMVVVAVASALAPTLLDHRADGQRLAVAGIESAVVAALPAAAATTGSELVVQAEGTPSAAVEAVREGAADGALVATDGRLELVGGDATLAAVVQQAVERAAVGTALARAGVPPPSTGTLQVRALPGSRENAVVPLLSTAFALLFVLTVFVFGMSIAQSVVEERQNRIVELLLAVVRPRQLLAGKVAAGTALALGQVVVVAACGLLAARLAGHGEVLGPALRSGPWFLLFFVLGFLMLACLWAAAGAVASRAEDLQTTTLPLQLLVTAPFLATVLLDEPGPWTTALSYLPVTAPLVMPRRLLSGDAGAAEAAVAAGLLVGACTVLVVAGARWYEMCLLDDRPWFLSRRRSASSRGDATADYEPLEQG